MRCLRPGGAYLFATPNKRHYFTRIAAALHRLHLDEFVLRLIKRSSVDEYHYAIQYRFNDEHRINSCTQQLGFLPPQYAYLESGGPVGYLRGPLRPILHLLSLKRRIVRNPRLLLTLVCRVTKPTRRPGAEEADGPWLAEDE